MCRAGGDLLLGLRPALASPFDGLWRSSDMSIRPELLERDLEMDKGRTGRFPVLSLLLCDIWRAPPL